jgi:hypothetical protein
VGLWALVGLGCAHRVELTSEPPGAEISVRGRPVGASPVELRVWWVPLGHLPVHAELQGYRDLDLDLQGDLGPVRILGEILTFRVPRLLGLKPRSSHQVVLVREHGPVGTWTPSDAE